MPADRLRVKIMNNTLKNRDSFLKIVFSCINTGSKYLEDFFIIG